MERLTQTSDKGGVAFTFDLTKWRKAMKGNVLENRERHCRTRNVIL